MKKPSKVIVLDDDSWFAESLASTLSYFDCQVRTVCDPNNIFEIIDKWLPDMLIMDLHLGAQNGLTLLNEMQSYDDTRAIKKVILSLSGHDIALDDVTEFGVVAVLDKANYGVGDIMKYITDEVGNVDKSDDQGDNPKAD